MNADPQDGTEMEDIKPSVALLNLQPDLPHSTWNEHLTEVARTSYRDFLIKIFAEINYGGVSSNRHFYFEPIVMLDPKSVSTIASPISHQQKLVPFTLQMWDQHLVSKVQKCLSNIFTGVRKENIHISDSIPEQSSSNPAVVPKATIAKEPLTKERLKVVEQRRKQQKEKHPYIPSKRHSIIATNTSTPLRPTSGLCDPLYILPDEIPEQSASSQSNGCDSILPGSHLNGNDFLLGTNTMQLSQYPAAEKLVMFSRQVMSNLYAVIGLKPSLNLSNSTHEIIPLAPATDTVLVASLPFPSLPSVRFGNKQRMKQRSSQIDFNIPTSTYYRPNGTMK